MGSVSDLAGRLRQLVDEVAAVDTSALSDDEAHELMVAVQTARSGLAVAAAGVLHDWAERGAWRADGTMRAALAEARATHGCHVRAKAELRRAAWLAQAPLTRAAVLDGRLSLDHVDLFMRYATAARMGVFLEHEAMLVDLCAGCALFDDARRVVQYWAQLADDELGLGREPPEPSRLYASRNGETGVLHLTGELDAIDAEIVERELRRLCRQLQLEDRRAGRRRTPAQRRAAALVRMAARSVNSTGMTARPLFQIVVGDETARRLCELGSGVVVSPEQAAAHIDTALMEVFLFDGRTTVIGHSRQRLFTGALRRAIQVRDRRCQHASECPVPAEDADVDHRTPAARGGPTSQFNARVQCVAHNRHPDTRDDAAPLPERSLDMLDALRCRLRWQYLRELDASEPSCAEVPR